jgi:hypothetical protein
MRMIGTIVTVPGTPYGYVTAIPSHLVATMKAKVVAVVPSMISIDLKNYAPTVRADWLQEWATFSKQTLAAATSGFSFFVTFTNLLILETAV